LLESLSAPAAAEQDVESVALIDNSGLVIMSNRADDVGSDVHLSDDVRQAMVNRRPAISSVSVSSDSSHPAIYHVVPVLEDASRLVLGVVRSRSSVAAIDHVVELAEDRTGAGAMGTRLDQTGLVLVDSLKPDWVLRPAVALSPDVSPQLGARRA